MRTAHAAKTGGRAASILTVALALAALATTLNPAFAASTAAPTAAPTAVWSAVPAAVLPGAAPHRAGVSKGRFVRETARRGDQDASPSSIEHVRELQYRLAWAGVYDGPVTGYFGDLTLAGVKRYQRRVRLPVTGEADRATWRHLIPATIRGRRHIPTACSDGTGWDACYDRARHEVTLWRDGRLRNAWLVRGGGTSTRTRTGQFTVYYRDIDHVSSLYGSPMPYSQFFSGGQAFHGSSTMVDPFSGHSHGCINMYIEDARQLWNLTSRRALAVHVHGAWS
jgi:peptidoglycan hydrolase-like protein with peptidoglycan-binding domain